tara:strand:- start:9641 stop:9970 length:330 start_codon:yes stop_codon:yes gene_type:complete
MKITKSKLKQLIREELEDQLEEGSTTGGVIDYYVEKINAIKVPIKELYDDIVADDRLQHMKDIDEFKARWAKIYGRGKTFEEAVMSSYSLLSTIEKVLLLVDLPRRTRK